MSVETPDGPQRRLTLMPLTSITPPRTDTD